MGRTCTRAAGTTRSSADGVAGALRRSAALVAFLALAACGSSGHRDSVDVYAAVSLREPLLAARERLEAAAGAPVSFNFGASNDLARQALAARRADVFLSADEIQMDVVEEAGLVIGATRRTLLTNALVIVTRPGGPVIAVPEDLAGEAVSRLSIADPSGVPAGRYARRWLEGARLWDRLAPRIAPAIDARAALAAVESGGAQAGIVYATDAALSDRVQVALRIPPDRGPAIRYAGAVLAGGGPEEGARLLLAFLSGDGAREVFGSYGFVVP